MSDCILLEQDGIVNLDFSGKSIVLEIPRAELVEGKVFDKSNPTYDETIRLWVSGDRIYVLHLFGHDRAWPNTVYEFPLEQPPKPTYGSALTQPLCCTQLCAWLAQGKGIPSAAKEQ